MTTEQTIDHSVKDKPTANDTISELRAKVKEMDYYSSFDTRYQILYLDTQSPNLGLEKSVSHVFNTLLNGIKSCVESRQGLVHMEARLSPEQYERVKMNTLENDQARELILKMIEKIKVDFGDRSIRTMKSMWSERASDPSVDLGRTISFEGKDWNPFEFNFREWIKNAVKSLSKN